MSIFRLLFGCPHSRMTFPQSKKNGPCHVVCLECGEEFLYDWQGMRVVRKREQKDFVLPAAERQPTFLAGKADR